MRGMKYDCVHVDEFGLVGLRVEKSKNVCMVVHENCGDVFSKVLTNNL